MTAPAEPVHALSFDIEDWFHLVEVDAVRDPASWPSFPSLVEDKTRLILGILAEFKVKATFFILGWIAERHPGLVGEIAAAGHELASHGTMHVPVWKQTRAEFADDIRRSLDAIARGAPRVPIRGYRAPSFSIVPGVEWALDVLAELGFTYDTSLFPAARGHGGYPCPREAHSITTPGGRAIRELPISTTRFGPARVCYSGGGYLRLLPLALIRRGIRREAAQGRPTVAYLHPRDFAPDCPRVPMSLARRFKSYVGLGTTERKLRALLGEYRWGTCEGALAAALGGAAPAPGSGR